jgi:A/G-specific adenine glycosylase
MAERRNTAAAAGLLAWYDKNRRILPWREDPTPYHVWLSEIMLQQTRVEAVKGYYERFLRVLPDIASLAAAKEEVYSKLWEGLGYYTRVRNLHRAACVICEQYGGVMPGTRAELLRLPGIGPYTSAAIASIAFGEPVPAVDGNLQRIFARVTGYEKEIRTKEARSDAEAWFAERISPSRPGDFNQALMDLGAMICLPNGAPKCSECPWEEICTARRSHRETDLPVLPARKMRKTEHKTVFLVVAEDHILLHKRPDTGLLAGLFEFPNVEGTLTEEEAGAYLASRGIRPDSVTPLPHARHVFTHLVWEMDGFLVRTGELPEGKDLKSADLSELAARYPIPSAFRVYREIAMRGL